MQGLKTKFSTISFLFGAALGGFAVMFYFYNESLAVNNPNKINNEYSDLEGYIVE